MSFAKFIPGTMENSIRGLNRAAEGTSSVPSAVLGNMMNKTVGGALVGGIGNAAIYSQSGQGMGGSTNYGEAIMGGAGVGAGVGVALGAIGTRSVMATAKGRIKKNGQQISKYSERILKKQSGLEEDITNLRAEKRQTKADLADTAEQWRQAGHDEDIIEHYIAPHRQAAAAALKDKQTAIFSGLPGLSKNARRKLQTTVYNRPVNPNP